MRYTVMNIIAWLCVVIVVGVFLSKGTASQDSRTETIRVGGAGSVEAQRSDSLPRQGQDAAIQSDEDTLDRAGTDQDSDPEMSSSNSDAVVLNDSAAVLMSEDQTEAAIRLLRSALQLDSLYARAHYNLGVAYHRLNRAGAAVAEYKTALRIRPYYYKPAYNLGLLYASIGNNNDALTALKRAADIRRSEESAPAHYHLGLVYSSLGKPEKARESYLEALRLRPGYKSARYNLALLAMADDQYAAAADDFEKVAALGFPKSKLYQNLGVCYSRLDKTAEAIDAYEKATQLEPDNVQAWFNLAVALNNTDRSTDAVAAYQRALSIDTTFYEAHFNLALIFAHSHRVDSAIAYYHRAIAANPTYTKAYYNLALTFSDLDQDDSAATYYQAVVELDPENLKALFNLGLALSRVDRTAESADAYRRLVDQDPTNEKGLNNLGTAYLKLDEFDSALVCFNRLVRLTDSPESYFNRAKANNELGRPADAMRDYETAIQRRPDYAKAYHNLAILVEDTGDLTRSVELLQQALTYDGDNWRSHWKLGQIYVKLGETAKARSEYELAARANPESQKFKGEYDSIIKRP